MRRSRFKRFVGIAGAAAVIAAIVAMAGMSAWAFVRQADTEGIAQEAFDLINVQRTEWAVTPLVWDDELAQLAVEHSAVGELPSLRRARASLD